MMNIPGVLLAAGMSTRMGQPKQLLPFGRSTVIETVIETLLASQLVEVMVVLGHQRQQICQQIEPKLTDHRLRIIANPDYRAGMLTSVQAALKQISPSSPAFALMLVDQPLITAGTVNQVLEAHRSTTMPITIPQYRSRRGHPAIFDGQFIAEILALDWESRGMKEILDRHREQIHYLPVETDSILRDMDTPQDYQRLLKMSTR